MPGGAYYNELDADAVGALHELMARGFIAPGEIDSRSIKDVQPDDLEGFTQVHLFAGIGVWSYAARSAGWADEREIFTGSCPCQPISNAGKRKGAADPRHLWPDMFRLVSGCRPAIVMGEQVAGALGYGWIDGVRSDLAAEAYALECADIAACGIDAPHIRNRLYWIAENMGHAHGDGWTGPRLSEGRGSRVPDAIGADGPDASSECNGSVSALADTERGERDGRAILTQRGSEGRSPVGRPDARSDGAVANGHEPFVRSIASAGEFATVQQDAGDDGISAARGVEHTAGQRRREGRAGTEVQRGRDAASCTNLRGVAQGDAQSITSGPGFCENGPQQHGPFASDADGRAGCPGVTQGDAASAGREGIEIANGREGFAAGRPDAERTDRGNGGRNGTFWSDAEWLLCHDRKARRAKPGIRLLANGDVHGLLSGVRGGDREITYLEGLAREIGVKKLPSIRIPLWRCAGNSIVLELAVEVIRAYLDHENETLQNVQKA